MLMATEEDGGGIVTLPPGGGGSKLRPPVTVVLGLEAPPFLVVMFYKKKKRSRVRERKRASHRLMEIQGGVGGTILTPILNLMVCPSLKPRSNLGRLSIS